MCERDYVANNFAHYIEKDDQPLRVELAQLKAIKEPKSETKKRIMELDVEVTEIMTYRSMIAKSDTKIDELTKLIENTKKFLWK
jgi:23S rRNA pseudoU1915 N3-methylase RlmH